MENLKIKNELKEIEDFYNFFYNFNFPIYLHKKYWNNKKQRYQTTNYYINNFKNIKREINSFHKDIYISIWDKIPMYTDKKRARNTVENSRATHYFVIDLDCDYLISEKIINKIIFYLYNQYGEEIPLPTAVISSGSGIHLYYKFDKLHIYKNKYKDYFIKLYKTAIETTKISIRKVLKEMSEINYFTEHEKFILKEIRIDEALKGSPTQLIRLVGSYNHGADNYCKIMYFNKNITYTLGEIIKEYNPKYTIENIDNDFKILSEKDFKEKKKVIKLKPNGYTENNTIDLNNRRLKDLKTLISIRQKNGTLVGTRQKIMSQAAWCLINNEYNGSQVDILQELMEIGSIIGNEFKTKKYCKKKIKHLKEYHKKRKKLSNYAIKKWLQIEKEEEYKLTNLMITKEKEKEVKRKEKGKIINKIKKDYSKGETVKNIAKKYKKSRTTIYKYLREEEPKQGSILNRCKKWTLSLNF